MANSLTSKNVVQKLVAMLQSGLESLQDAVRTKKRLFVCGLALDFCVLDTCINAVALGFESVHIVLDAARAAHIPGFGQFGTGFLSDPKEVFDKQVQLVTEILHQMAFRALLEDECIDNERAAILSEKQMRNTIGYRRSCKMMEMMVPRCQNPVHLSSAPCSQSAHACLECACECVRECDPIHMRVSVC